MEDLHRFKIDNSLRISSQDKSCIQFLNKKETRVIGKKYYDVFPRFMLGKKDAVRLVFKNKKKLILNNYPINCLYGLNKADIEIFPEDLSNGRVKHVRITITPRSKCAAATAVNSIRDNQKLINIGKIASTLAHGVRNPLNALKGAVVYIMKKYDQEATLMEFSKIMETEISRLDSFISKFLSTSLSNEEKTDTDINKILRKIKVYISLQATSFNIKTKFRYGDVPLLKLNSFLIEQALLNVMNNAIEAMSSGGILTIRTQVQNISDTDYVHIEISDTGGGISPEKFAAIARPDSEKGRGFGLFTTREILKFHSGYMEINTRKDAGTSVGLYIPSTTMVK